MKYGRELSLVPQSWLVRELIIADESNVLRLLLPHLRFVHRRIWQGAVMKTRNAAHQKIIWSFSRVFVT